MYLSTRAAVVKNFSVAIINGTITLVLLLIAPLGLAAVIGNTFLVTVASFFVGTFIDMVVDWLSLSGITKHNFSLTRLYQKIPESDRISQAIQKNK